MVLIFSSSPLKNKHILGLLMCCGTQKHSKKALWHSLDEALLMNIATYVLWTNKNIKYSRK